MRVLAKVVMAAVLLVGGAGVLGVVAQPARAEVATVVQAPTTTLDEHGGGGPPSMLPRPGEDESPTNAIGFIVAIGLFLLWIGGMAFVFLRAARRRGPVPG